jgi:hypothetical protein
MKMKRGQISGQVVIEYILLLIISVAIAILIIDTMVSRSPEGPGFLIVKWTKLIRFIGSDPIEQITRLVNFF